MITDIDTNQKKHTEGKSECNASLLPQLAEAEELGASLKRIMVRSEQALTNGDARDGIEQVERWVESYRRGLSAAQKISDVGIEMLKRTRNQLALSLDERLRLEDEGGNPPTKEHAADTEELAKAIRHIDKLLPQVEESFTGGVTEHAA